MRGGSRPGAGRPRIYGKRVQLSILISEETKTKLNEVSKLPLDPAKLKELAEAQDKPLAGVVEQLIINEHQGLIMSS